MAENIKELTAGLKNAANKAHLAKDQEEYEKYYDLFFEKLDLLENELKGKRFLNGDIFSEEDIALYDILVNWNTVWFFAFRLNRNRLEDFEELWRYARDIYRNEGGRERTDFEKIKFDYYSALDDVRNPYHIIPIGPDTEIWESA